MKQVEVDRKCCDTIRFLALDAIQQANSGHPGLPLGAADMAYALWSSCLRHDPAAPDWFDRDRFVLSAGHGSMLHYSLLHLSGYSVSMDDLKSFRSLNSRTPGHPERGKVPGVEVTTGPLGQGLANSVGLAMAEAHLAARFNQPGHEIIDHWTWALVSDGDLMEGISSEAASLAGHLGLGKLVVLYDDNRISLGGSTELTFSENRAARFSACGWQVIELADGHDLQALKDSLEQAKNEMTKPTIILARTRIGYGSPGLEGSFQAHGSPFGPEEVKRTKEKAGWPLDPAFFVPDEVRMRFNETREHGSRLREDWLQRLAAYERDFPQKAAELRRLISGELPADWPAAVLEFPASEKGMATRVSAARVLDSLAAVIPEMAGGSADLNPSTQTVISGGGDFQSPCFQAQDRQGSVGGPWNYAGRNIHFGVREHAMAAIGNGLAAHGGILPFVSTFLVFADYLRPSLRLAALMELQVIHVYTHDSIGVGEDGPTHQPVEHYAALRAIPNLLVIRPADANETAWAWKLALQNRKGPSALVLTRQALPTLDRDRYAPASGVMQGAYVISPENGGLPDLIMIASGSEVTPALEAQQTLQTEGIAVRVVSMPCRELFAAQPPAYRETILPASVRARLVIEAGIEMGWHNYYGSWGEMISMNGFGASAPGPLLMEKFGFSAADICRRARNLLQKLNHE